jgi:hydrogenase/urease accessory protein HupE
MSRMKSAWAPAWALLAAALAGLLLFVPVAEAHGLGSEDPNRPVAEYLWLGTKHLLLGWDHLLFIAAVVLVSGSLWRATKMLSLFVLGHSITLALATWQEWTVSTTFVDIVVALSVVAVAAAGLSNREINWRLFGGGLFAFGLIHGLGLATRLQELGVSDNDLMWRVLMFNIGVEIGQALAVLAIAAVGYFIVRAFSGPWEQRTRLAFTAIGLAGLIGAMVLSFSGSEEADPPATEVAETTVPSDPQECEVEEVRSTIPFAGGGHPERNFYEPDEEYPSADFAHVLFDGYVVVEYRADLPAGDVEEIRGIADSGIEGIVDGASGDQEDALVATTLEREFRCSEVDVDALVEFRDDWITDYLGQP